MYLLLPSFMLIFCLHSPAKEIMMTKKFVRKRDISACRCVCLSFTIFKAFQRIDSDKKHSVKKFTKKRNVYCSIFLWKMRVKKRWLKITKMGETKKNLLQFIFIVFPGLVALFIFFLQWIYKIYYRMYHCLYRQIHFCHFCHFLANRIFDLECSHFLFN